MEPSASFSPSARHRAWSMVRRVGLLVLLIVGALGGYQIWQISLATSTYVVVLEAQRDVTGTGNESFVDTEQLLSVMQYEVGLPDEPPLLTVPGAPRQVVEVSVRGRDRRRDVANGRLHGRLHYAGADPDRLELRFSSATVDGDTLRHVLEHDAADEFLTGTISALVAVRNQHGDPVTGLSGGIAQRMEESEQLGVYTITTPIEDLLWSLMHGKQEEIVEAELGEQRFELRVPLAWFVAASASEHVVRVQEVTTTRQLVPEPRSLSPRAVSAGSAWGGDLEVRGKNLDLVVDALLRRGETRVPCTVTGRHADRLALSVDPGRLDPGSYDLVLSAAGVPEPLRLPSGLTVRAEARPALALVAPSEGSKVGRDEELEIRWEAPGLSGEILIEGTAHAGDGMWMEIFRGPISRGRHLWDLRSLDAESEGPYLLRMSLLDQTSLAPVLRRIEVVSPAEVSVKLRFLLEGRRYGMIKEIRIDGEPIELGKDPAVVGVRLPRGMHTLRAEGLTIQDYLGKVEVTHEGQIVEIELQK